MTSAFIEDAPESPQEDSGAPTVDLESLPTQDTTTPLSDSLRGSLSASEPLAILGPESFELALVELFKTAPARKTSRDEGVIFAPVDGVMRFLFRDEYSRARFIYQALMGLSYPCTKGEAERRKLYEGFEAGWDDGSLRFLSSVPSDELGFYSPVQTRT